MAGALRQHGTWPPAQGLEKRGPHITAFRGTAHQSRQCQRVQSSAQTEHDLLTQQQVSAPSAAEPVEDGGPLGRILSSGGKSAFRGATWVVDLVPWSEAAESSSVDSSQDDTDDSSGDLEDLPQGYRTADHVAVYNVPSQTSETVTSMDEWSYNNNPQLSSSYNSMSASMDLAYNDAHVPQATTTHIGTDSNHQPSAAGRVQVPVAAAALATAPAERAAGAPRASKLAPDDATLAPARAATREPRLKPRRKRTKSRLVVCKVSQFRDSSTRQMDWFKYAATLNEWTTFNKHATDLKCRHVVQLLGFQQSQDSMYLVSEFCSGGDLQTWLDQYNERNEPALRHTPQPHTQQLHSENTESRSEAGQCTEQSGKAGPSGRGGISRGETDGPSGAGASTVGTLGRRRLIATTQGQQARRCMTVQPLLSRKRLLRRAVRRAARRVFRGALRVGRLLVGGERIGLQSLVQDKCDVAQKTVTSAWVTPTDASVSTVQSMDGVCPECGAADCTTMLYTQPHTQPHTAKFTTVLNPPMYVQAHTDQQGLQTNAFQHSIQSNAEWGGVGVLHESSAQGGSYAPVLQGGDPSLCVWECESGALGVQGGGVRLSETQVAHVVLHVLRGLRTLHQAGLTHGDIKPANVFISPSRSRARHDSAPSSSSSGSSSRSSSSSNSSSSGSNSSSSGGGSSGGKTVVTSVPHILRDCDTFKLGDFGTLRETGRRNLHYFVAGFGFTPEYAAPEALRHGTGRAGLSADMWSVGIMMLQLLLGHLPSTAVAMAQFHEQGAAPSTYKRYLAQHPPACMAMREMRYEGVQLSRELEEVLRSCLQVSPRKRVPDAEALMSMSWFARTGLAGQVSHQLEAVP